MGQKIATEEDYWMCSSGIMPARMQSIQPVVKQKDGKRYLLQTDTATASAGDFVCKWMMLLMAAIAAIVAVVVVATGGAALGAIVAAGAIAGAAGAAGGAILGGLVCGQKAAMLRVWKVEKSNLLIGGQKTLTSASYMTCPVFSSEIKRAPNIKNWWQALLVGMGNFGTTVVEGALGGAMIGTVGALLAGAATLALPTIGSVLTNVGASFTGLGLAVRGVFGVNAASNEWASGDVNNMGDAAKSFAGGAVPEAGSIKRIATGQAQPSDALLLLYFLHLKTPVQEPHSQPEEEEGKPKDEEATNSAKPENEPEPTKPGEDGKGYELGPARTKLINGDPPFKPGKGHSVAEFERQIKGQEEGMNKLTVDEFIKNRDAYLEKMAEEKAAGKKNPSGRSKDSAKAQERFRERVREDKIDEYREQNYSREDAEKMADDYLSDKAALHDPDQVAGGFDDRITGMGDTKVNSSIGRQWQDRIGNIDSQVREQANGMTEAERKSTYLNVHLYP